MQLKESEIFGIYQVILKDIMMIKNKVKSMRQKP